VLGQFPHGSPPTIQQVRRALGMKAKSSLYSACWMPVIDTAIQQGRIERPRFWRGSAQEPRRDAGSGRAI
jgi:hypothetical protein